MNCCSNCFSSPYIKGIIDTNQTIANCDVCLQKNINTYKCSDLVLYFLGLLELYECNEMSKYSLISAIDNDLNQQVFSKKLDSDKKKYLLLEIVKDELDSYSQLFESNVSLKHLVNEENNKQINLLNISWTKFAHEIKETNRFHINNMLDLSRLEKLLKRYERPIRKGKTYFRGRISNKEGFKMNQMGAPPLNKAKSGRANPTGIPYLYISDKLKTTLYETRSSLFDYVTIAEFRLSEDIKVINLKGNEYDFMQLEDELGDFLLHLPFINKLEAELSKPYSKDDKELDYLPTQYLSEFIKSIGYDGIEYKSSLYNEGYNLVIFNSDKFECIKTEVHRIKEIHFNYILIT